MKEKNLLLATALLAVAFVFSSCFYESYPHYYHPHHHHHYHYDNY